MVVAALGAACGQGGGVSTIYDLETTQGSKPTTVQLSADEYTYSMGETTDIVGGAVVLEFENQGAEAHEAVIHRLNDGVPMEAVQGAIQAGDLGAVRSMTAVPGGVAAVSPRPDIPVEENDPQPPGTAMVTASLQPGTYFFGCYIQAEDGQSHLAKGMVLPFTVSSVNEADVRQIETVVKAEDGVYTADLARSGPATIMFDNQGTQLHQFTIVEFAQGKGVDDLENIFTAPEDDPVGTALGGYTAQPGSVGSASFALVRDTGYAFVCFIPDPADGVPWYKKGMLLSFTAGGADLGQLRQQREGRPEQTPGPGNTTP